MILGAGLDSFAERHVDLLNKITVFEVDQIEAQIWKKQRLQELGYALSHHLIFVGVDFEQGWWQELIAAGFNPNLPAVVVSTGVTMYLTREANLNMFSQMTQLAQASSFITTFILPVDLVEPEHQAGFKTSMQGAAKSDHPFINLFRPHEIEQLFQQAGFKNAEQISSKY